MAKKTAFQHDKERNISRIMVRLNASDRAVLAEARTVEGAYAPTVAAIVRRGIRLAVEEIKTNAKKST